jgi:dephospho-CoA kinase
MMTSATQMKIIGLSGQSGAGKTYVAKELARILKIGVVSFCSYVRAEALQREKGTDRVTLQELGQALIDEYGCEKFVQRVFHFGGVQNGIPLLLDGVRHVDIWQAVQKVSMQSALIYFHCDESQRVERLLMRDHLESASVQSIMQQPMDRNIVQLRPIADLVVINESGEGMIAEIVGWLRQKDLA